MIFLFKNSYWRCFIYSLAWQSIYNSHILAQNLTPEDNKLPNNIPQIEQIQPQLRDINPNNTQLINPDDRPILNNSISRPNIHHKNSCLINSQNNGSIFIKNIQILGNTIFQEEINNLIKPFAYHWVNFEDLLCLRSAITQLYFDGGYITSGAFLLNNQEISDGEIKIQVLEGELERIDITGLSHLQENYIRSRLQIPTQKPLNQKSLESALKLLQLNPILERVNAELTVGSSSGKSILKINLQESPSFTVGVGFDNYRSPSIGSQQVRVFAEDINWLGIGDRLSFEYALTDGLDLYDITYTIPWNTLDGTIAFRYTNSDSSIIENRFKQFDITSETEAFSTTIRQPLYKTSETELAIGIGLDLRQTQTYLLNEPFSFSLGPEDGKSKLTVLRFFQDWLDRSPHRIIAARSQFSWGLDAFGATINNLGTDGSFFTWLGQFQWVEQLSSHLLLIVSADAQLTPDSLLSIEQFSIGGIDTIRGYRQNQLVGDNGVVGSLEFRIGLTADPSIIQITPFFEIGTIWNNITPAPERSTIASLGLGVRWLVLPGLNFRLDYGIPLIKVDEEGDSLQENGLSFALLYRLF
jgi:hemolysin activation/secretion protein